MQVVQRWIVMRLRDRKFFSIAEANQAIWELLAQLNQRPFRKRREESRASLFEKLDRPALQPLPAERYDLSFWAQARVNIFCGLGGSVALRDSALCAPRISLP